MADMRQFHVYIVAAQGDARGGLGRAIDAGGGPCDGGGGWAVRLMRVVALATWGLVIAPSGGWPAGAVPGACPPICGAIPDAAWVDATAVPLYTVYRWPALAGLAVTAPSARFGFEAVCGSSPIGEDPRAYAVGARSVVLHPEGQWNLLVQVIHWRGDTATGGREALSTLGTARSRLRDCQSNASPSITTDDTQRVAAVISV